MPLLKLENVVVNYGSIEALKGISFEVYEKEIITLLGANGAGKSTTMRSIMGLKSITSGNIIYDGEDISNKPTREMVTKGLILSPEGRQVFPDFTVRENLEMGAYIHPSSTIAEREEMVFQLFPKLKSRIGQAAGTLSGGEQQMLAVGRALMAKPRLLLLDEPSLGLAPMITKEIFELIKNINEMGTTVLLVEQNARVALRHSNRAYVMETGKVVLQNDAKAMLESQDIIDAYLGG